jgi:hypothetical protein
VSEIFGERKRERWVKGGQTSGVSLDKVYMVRGFLGLMCDAEVSVWVIERLGE